MITTTERTPFPANGVCPCGSDDWHDTEPGYVRMSGARFEDGVLQVFMDGWDDMSEGGDDHYAQCAACGEEFALPSEVNYS
jgi:hypothetical protein